MKKGEWREYTINDSVKINVSEYIERVIKHGKYRETGNIGCARQRQTQHNMRWDINIYQQTQLCGISPENRTLNGKPTSPVLIHRLISISSRVSLIIAETKSSITTSYASSQCETNQSRINT